MSAEPTAAAAGGGESRHRMPAVAGCLARHTASRQQNSSSSHFWRFFWPQLYVDVAQGGLEGHLQEDSAWQRLLGVPVDWFLVPAHAATPTLPLVGGSRLYMFDMTAAGAAVAAGGAACLHALPV